MPNVKGDVSSFFGADRAMGDRGIVDVGLGLNPAGWVAELCGSETFAMMTVSDRDIIHALCEREMNVILNTLRFLLSHKVGPYFSMCGEEFVVPPLHGPKDFYDFNVKYDKPIIDLIHQADGRMHIHSHGSIKKVMQGFVDMGADVLHPFEPPPMGDITPAEAKAMVRGRLCLEGNIQIADMYEKSSDDIREQTKVLIETCFADHRGLIVSPTASPYIRGAGEKCFPQYKAMIDEVIAWK
jgi:uroporphyrinogen-III decarboxylase